MKYISRHMENRILELSKSYSAILLTGPRQAGKTTMLRELAEKENIGRRYVTLDNLSERDLAKNDPALFLQLHKPPVLIDEVQYAPELFTYVKIHIDEHHKPGDFWMTGSQIFRLMRGVQESLAGRVALLHMSPMSQREIVGSPCVPFTTDMERLLDERDPRLESRNEQRSRYRQKRVPRSAPRVPRKLSLSLRAVLRAPEPRRRA